MVAISDWNRQITSEEQVFGDYVSEVYTSTEPDWPAFSTSELAELVFEKDKFQKYSARQIREFSHLEQGYQETKGGEIISYQYAQTLQSDAKSVIAQAGILENTSVSVLAPGGSAGSILKIQVSGSVPNFLAPLISLFPG